MNDKDKPEYDETFIKEVKEKEDRKVDSRNKPSKSVFFGLGMFGLVGWSVAIPVILFTFLGNWIDKKWPSEYSWTLTLLFIGLVLGCLHAWYWIENERKDDKK